MTTRLSDAHPPWVSPFLVSVDSPAWFVRSDNTVTKCWVRQEAKILVWDWIFNPVSKQKINRMDTSINRQILDCTTYHISDILRNMVSTVRDSESPIAFYSLFTISAHIKPNARLCTFGSQFGRPLYSFEWTHRGWWILQRYAWSSA